MATSCDRVSFKGQRLNDQVIVCERGFEGPKAENPEKGRKRNGLNKLTWEKHTVKSYIKDG